jgi:hypothetical protein
MRSRAWLALASALVVASCGAPLMKLPPGPGAPATDAAEALVEAIAACGTISTMSAEVGVAGRVGGRRTRGRLLAGLASPASAYLDAPTPFGASAFIFAARENDATLLLPRDRRVLEHGRPADVLEAVAGVALGPGQLLATLTGCAQASAAAGGRTLGPDWRKISGPPDLYLHRERPAAPWRLVLVVHRDAGRGEWQAEYREFSDDLPHAIRLTSLDSSRFDLRLTMSQVEINAALDEGTFQLRVPPGYAPITIDQLRDAGPLADVSKRDE